MGEEWLPIYLTSPIWRFVLSAGLCGGEVVAGVLMPSVDRVGRYFPFTLAVPLAGCSNPAAVPMTGAEWFDKAEGLAPCRRWRTRSISRPSTARWGPPPARPIRATACRRTPTRR